MEIVSVIFEVCLLPLLAVLTSWLISFLKAKRDELVDKSKNDTLDKYINLLHATIEECVIATNQTYVESLKKSGSFDLDAQKIALQKTFGAVQAILSEDAKMYLSEAIGDLNQYILARIEATVNYSKIK